MNTIGACIMVGLGHGRIFLPYEVLENLPTNPSTCLTSPVGNC